MKNFIVTLSTTNYLQQVADNVCGFLNDIAPFVYVIVAAALMGMGALFIFGGERARQAAKEKVPFILIGTVLVLGCTVIAQAISGTFTFTQP